ncbi:hypothetical protein FB45DRAFT_719535, partial [Roridomyces roridus]
KLAQIRSQIAALESQLAVLHEQEQRVSTALDSIVYSVLGTFPLDITSEIFAHYLEVQDDAYTSRPTPLTLASVCSQWRSIALASPRLWPALHTGKP